MGTVWKSCGKNNKGKVWKISGKKCEKKFIEKMGKKWGNKVWGKCEKPKSGKNVKNSRGKILEKNVEKNWRWKNVDKWLGAGEKREKMSVWRKAWQISVEKYYISSCDTICNQEFFVIKRLFLPHVYHSTLAAPALLCWIIILFWRFLFGTWFLNCKKSWTSTTEPHCIFSQNCCMVLVSVCPDPKV